MRYMWKFKVGLQVFVGQYSTIVDGMALMSEKTYVTAHVVVSPSLESCTGVVGVLAVDLDELVKDTSSEIQVLVSEVLAQD